METRTPALYNHLGRVTQLSTIKGRADNETQVIQLRGTRGMQDKTEINDKMSVNKINMKVNRQFLFSSGDWTRLELS